jgi:sigma-B regulation protein RsbU (phosphoserine phosphatase)
MTTDVLVVDDDDEIRELIVLSLGDGFAIETASDGAEAWSLLTDGGLVPDCIVLDVMMPEVNGVSVLKRVRNHDPTSDVPVLMLTSRSREEDVVTTLEAGADDFLPKPFEPAELESRVRELV